MSKKSKAPAGLNEPFRHQDHPRPRTRREFLAQGFITGAATVVAPTLAGYAGLSARRAGLPRCRISRPWSAPAISPPAPARSRSSASTSPAAATSPAPTCWSAVPADSSISSRWRVTANWVCRDPWCRMPAPTGNFVDASFGLRYHSDSAHLRGMKARASAAAHGGHERHDHSRAVAERHQYQSAQSDVRHLSGRRARRSAQSDRLGKFRVGRQFHVAADHGHF